MNKHIIVEFQLFDATHKVMIYEDGACKSIYEVATGNIEGMLKNYSEDPNVKKIDLIGNKEYLEKIKNNIMTDFSHEDIQIDILEK